MNSSVAFPILVVISLIPSIILVVYVLKKRSKKKPIKTLYVLLGIIIQVIWITLFGYYVLKAIGEALVRGIL